MKTYEKLDGIQFRLSRNRTKIIDCQNMVIPVYDKGIPKPDCGRGKYYDYNYKKRMKMRSSKISEICYNSFKIGIMKFITLTFDPKLFEKDFACNIEKTHSEFKLFIKRINDHYDNFRYIATFSRQQNKYWHYHMLCNFDSTVTQQAIRTLWKNGSVCADNITDTESFKRVKNYLIKNMYECENELHGAKGYLYSKNLDRDITISSWNPLQEAECDNLADLIMSGKSYLTHSTSKTIGIERTKADDITGEAIEELMPNQQITPEYEKLGFAECISKYDYYSSDISFADQFKPLVQATPKNKKFKHKKFKNSGGTS
ncbi:MAG: hypothetical protein J6B75_06300 [Ruminococcus sp.]|nr:hypothetical protein [Ruminococcus sp.]